MEEKFKRVFIVDGWLIVRTNYKMRDCTRLYNLTEHKWYKLKFAIIDIVDDLFMDNDLRVMDFKDFISSIDHHWVEHPPAKHYFKGSDCLFLHKGGYFTEDNYYGDTHYYKVVDNKLISLEYFEEQLKLLFSDDYINELTRNIKTSTRIIDAIIKNVILRYWGV